MQTRIYPDVPADFGYWLAGFIDGEGCFSITHHRKQWVPRFCISLRADDRPLLAEVRQRTGLGKVYGPYTSSSSDRNGKPFVHWRADTKSDALHLITILERFPLRSKKARDYAIWREACLCWEGVQARSYPGKRSDANWEPIRRFAIQLKAIREYPSSR